MGYGSKIFIHSLGHCYVWAWYLTVELSHAVGMTKKKKGSSMSPYIPYFLPPRNNQAHFFNWSFWHLLPCCHIMYLYCYILILSLFFGIIYLLLTADRGVSSHSQPPLHFLCPILSIGSFITQYLYNYDVALNSNPVI